MMTERPLRTMTRPWATTARSVALLVPCTTLALMLSACAPPAPEETASVALALGQPLGAEDEPNGGAALATPISKNGVVRASLSPNAEDDYYSFPGIAGERVYAATMTAFAAPMAGKELDSLLEVIGTDGVTVIESDDDDGAFGAKASSIAGAPLLQTGTSFLRVHNKAGSNTRPYDLHLVTHADAPTPEVEPNGSALAAQPVPPSGWMQGEIGAAGDADFYSIALSVGDTLFASLDLDPTRDGTELDGTLAFGPFGNTFLQPNDPGGPTGPHSRALFATVKAAGTYAVVVGSAGGTGDYHLSVSVHPAAPAPAQCKTYTNTNDLAIPAGPGVVTSSLTVPGNPRVGDLNVSVTLSHTSPVDLDVILQAPNKAQVGLFTDVATGSFPSIDVVLDDEAAIPISFVAAPTGLVLQPEADHRLDWFDGESAGGIWTLRLADDTANNGGTLDSWGITVCEPTAPPACAGGLAPLVPLQQDFEANDGAFTHNGTLDSWARGTPTQAPDFVTCNSGSRCFKTNLSGNYSDWSTQELVSPPIDLAGVQTPIGVSWAMKYQLESANYDHAWVDVREVGTMVIRRLFEWRGPTMSLSFGGTPVPEAAGWGLHTADISAFAGKTVQLVFHLDSDISTNFGGMAIDDVKVTACPTPVCGNAVLESGEECDDGNFVDGDGCDSNCTDSECGNEIVTLDEECDDGNEVDGDGCDSNCTVTGCGNGIVTPGEVCDDGNQVNGDGCDDGEAGNCTVSECGNGVPAGIEECDDDNEVDGDGCDANCTLTMCGNGVLTNPEICDDGNEVDGDGCDHNCTPTICGNAVAAAPEECDDGNEIDGDGCDHNCTPSGCGNGVQDPSEACDDGNFFDGDGCSPTCAFEPTNTGSGGTGGSGEGVTVTTSTTGGSGGQGGSANDDDGYKSFYDCSASPSAPDAPSVVGTTIFAALAAIARLRRRRPRVRGRGR